MSVLLQFFSNQKRAAKKLVAIEKNHKKQVRFFLCSRKASITRNLPAEKHVAVFRVELSKLVLWKRDEFLSVQNESLHHIQILVPILHQLRSLQQNMSNIEDKVKRIRRQRGRVVNAPD